MSADGLRLSEWLGESPRSHVKRYLALNAGLCLKDGLPLKLRKEMPTQVPLAPPPRDHRATSPSSVSPKKSKRTLSQRLERSRRIKCLRIRIAEIKNRAKARPCMDCNIQYNPWVMDFDHRDQSNKLGIVSKMRNSISSLLTEIEKCDVVCSNCHRERSQKQLKSRPDHYFSPTKKLKRPFYGKGIPELLAVDVAVEPERSEGESLLKISKKKTKRTRFSSLELHA